MRPLPGVPGHLSRVLLLCALCSGCLHYSLRDPAPLPFRSIAIAPIASPAWTHLTQDLLRRELAREIAGCPSLRLADCADDADAILEIVPVDFSQGAASTAPGDSRRATSYNLRLEARCTLRDRRSGREYCQGQTVAATVSCPAGPRSIANRRDALPELVRELALRIHNLILGLR
ncbi:MAG: LPS assembly lipoprotein LptE [Puniceicoccales bacterium]|jgi:hypothetical protein|nr:LPS assembly lipoprotein LptE [Puniceicoccales bacterium]